MEESGDKTVYFLGAGASHASEFKLPIMQGFFRKEDLESGRYSNLAQFVEQKFRGVLIRELNLEEVITYLELSLENFGSFGEHAKSGIHEARREFDQYVHDRLNTPELKGCREHKKIIDQNLASSDSKDSIITLNYDLVVDNTLYEVSPKNKHGQLEHGYMLDRSYSLLGETRLMHGKRASLYHKDKELGFYLKLHGSIDWIYCSNPSCSNHQEFFPNWLGSPSVHDRPGEPCKLCGLPLVRAIVPPTMKKSVEEFPKLGLLWRLAYQELHKAQTIVIFGVSFAASDYYLRWLFKKAVTERESAPTIFDIDINGSVREEVEKITGVEPVYMENLDEFLKHRL